MEEIMNPTTVDVALPESVADDAQQASESTADLLNAVASSSEKEQEQNAQSVPAKEPGWIRNRIDKAVSKAVAENTAKMQAEFDRQLAPIRESMLAREAQMLVEAGEFKSKERALEYCRLKNGMPAVAPETPAEPSADKPARDSNGRFAKADSAASGAPDPTQQAQANLLARQAQRIKSKTGLDVMQLFNSDPEIQRNVLSGEWDFYDVAEEMKLGKPRSNAPTPIRSSGGASGNVDMTIANMTDEQFAKLQANLASGHRYDMRK